MTKVQVYLNFPGTAEEAFVFYEGVFGTKISSVVRFKDMPVEGFTLPKEAEDKIMHIALPISDGSLLMASDALESLGHKLSAGNNVYISLHPESRAEADRLFAGLSAGGSVEMPMDVQPWGDYYGSFSDRYGIRWMVNYAMPRKVPHEFVRYFDVPVEAVWEGYTDPSSARGWWGPRNFTMPVYEIDLRPGGRYLNAMRGPDGKDYWSTGTFREVVPMKRLVLTDSFADEKGNVVSAAYYGMNADFPMESLVTVTFEQEGDRTKFTVRYDDVSPIPENDRKAMIHGWEEMLDKFDEYLEK